MNKTIIFITPCPKQIEWKEGEFALPSTIRQTEKVFYCCNKLITNELHSIIGKNGMGLVKIRIDDGAVDAPSVPSQAYMLKVSHDGIDISANTDIGALYALQTLRQLKRGPRRFACVSILDWPDAELRIAARPLLCGEATRSALEWGDGKAALMRRWRHEIDFALRYRYNGIFVHGFTWDTHAWRGFASDMRKLNDYARLRGVRLIFGGYGIGHGGWGEQAYIGEAHAFLPGFGHRFRQDYPCSQNNPNNDATAYNGTCRGNAELRRMKVEDAVRFIKAVRPGALYIHHEDQSLFYGECQPYFWDRRCPICRKKWPNDALEAADGGAGAIADGYDVYCEACAKVKSDGYDATKDCALLLCSPCYGNCSTPTEEWSKIETLWLNIARQMKGGGNVFFVMREQFAEIDGEGRLERLSRLLRENGSPQRLMTFYVSGAALYGDNAVFSSLPAMNGAVSSGNGAMFDFSGVLFQRPQQIFNSECSWNIGCREGGEALPLNDRKRIFNEYAESLAKRDMVFARHAAKDGWLAKACQQLYGPKAGRLMFKYQLLRTPHGDGPLVLLYQQIVMERLKEKLNSPPIPDANPAGLKRPVTSYADAAARWGEQATLTKRAVRVVSKASSMVSGWLGEELAYQAERLRIGAETAVLVERLYRRLDGEDVPAATLHRSLGRLRRMMLALPHDYPSRNDGDGSLDMDYLAILEDCCNNGQ